jgi:hypothetical protein
VVSGLRVETPSQTSKKYFAKVSFEIGSSSIWILSRIHLKSGEVYSPTLAGKPVLRPCARRIERMKAQVLPFPLVPATCMTFKLSTSLSWQSDQHSRAKAQQGSTKWPKSRSQVPIPTKLGVPRNVGSPFKPGISPIASLPGPCFGLAFRRLVSKIRRAFCMV